MEKWMPIFWILGIGIAILALLLVIDLLKSNKKKR